MASGNISSGNIGGVGYWSLGSHESDKLYAAAFRRAAVRFGAKIVQERVFEDTGGARHSNSGLVQIQSQIPLFTQSAPAYDVLVAADESQVFAPYLPYRTSEPKLVAGSAGLVPTSWDAAHDQWGAIQLQNRFGRMFSRRMTALDMQAWTGVRMIGEAVERTQSADAAKSSLTSRARTSRLRHSRAESSQCAIGIFSCASRSFWPMDASSCRCPRKRASCTNIRSSTRWAFDRPETKCQLK